MLFVERKAIPNGEPCEHPGCLRHVTHPCEGCGRIAGYTLPELPEMWRQYFAQLEKRVRELEAENKRLWEALKGNPNVQIIRHYKTRTGNLD